MLQNSVAATPLRFAEPPLRTRRLEILEERRTHLDAAVSDWLGARPAP